jgi:hypothetical protein
VRNASEIKGDSHKILYAVLSAIGWQSTAIS